MSKSRRFHFRLYVAGDAPNSLQAVTNLNAICREHLADCHHIEIVDVVREPERALQEEILITPMLLKLAPGPVCKIIGNLSDHKTVLHALELQHPNPNPNLNPNP